MAAHENPSVLLVEDNPDDERLAIRAFRRSNVDNVVVARDGAEAIEALSSPEAEHFTLVLLDLKLPKRNGFEVLKHLRAQAHTRLLPVVILTSSDEESDVKHAYENGANGFICKPVDFDGYMESMEQAMRFWLRMNRVPHNN